MKILVTKELGRLAKWLRILGIDCEYSRTQQISSIMMQALREDRIILTRNRHLPASRGITIVIVESQTINEQLPEVCAKIGISIEHQKLFSRCTICNKKLQEVSPDTVRDFVPEYVFSTQKNFYQCSNCKRIYWQGTHWGNVQEILAKIKT
ncbi:MAG: Mut7-C RNAse domain-containing protein [Candidatus Omnitrophica bacterium]|nr:Mut7-C RNAse domain-containing protein [Candidatus Omnitrophota bacterium]